MKRIFSLLNVMLLIFAITGTSDADLICQDGGVRFDEVLDITWLQDEAHPNPSNFDSDGLITWEDAVAWADGLEFNDSDRSVTKIERRITTTGGVNDTGISWTAAKKVFFILTNEMGYWYQGARTVWGILAYTGVGLYK